ncbi:hypothetical protein [Flammeovirga sp. EKP202]|uniref:hypothetical protein n=1 Tax=Flammeovirga sp. EKP202 TaxID=2770592 RepID=UPI00165F03E9|nr:hypothetical protein [Flammeovirga sp. EKP202]MBD0403700.1 hypothetical protein [Flammeovirga sp. EKP202]
MKQTSIISIFLSILFFSCNEDETTLEYLYPTEIGNQWSYKLDMFKSDSLIFDQDYTIEITGTKELNGYNCFVFEEQNETRKGEKYYTFSDNKFLYVGSNYSGYSPIFDITTTQSNLRTKDDIFLFPADSCPIVYDYPLLDNKTWEYYPPVFTRIKEVIGDTIITVPAGTFQCKYICTTENERFTTKEFINKDYGLIKKELIVYTDVPGIINGIDSTKYIDIHELVDYNIL